MSFTRDEVAMLDKAIQGEVSRLKRQHANGPRFKEVADRMMADYTSLMSKVRSLENEASSGQKGK